MVTKSVMSDVISWPSGPRSLSRLPRPRPPAELPGTSRVVPLTVSDTFPASGKAFSKSNLSVHLLEPEGNLRNGHVPAGKSTEAPYTMHSRMCRLRTQRRRPDPLGMPDSVPATGLAAIRDGHKFRQRRVFMVIRTSTALEPARRRPPAQLPRTTRVVPPTVFNTFSASENVFSKSTSSLHPMGPEDESSKSARPRRRIDWDTLHNAFGHMSGYALNHDVSIRAVSCPEYLIPYLVRT
ncbi:hypothetical protein C8Q80DRAFT_520803 [Daedaleopsis nitida]|nr:hypothetical protein C8Q80DRAFT_520803 [Daedaleopsis nitida]